MPILPKEKPPATGDIALAGKDGERVESLLDKGQSEGVTTLYDLTRSALARHFQGGHFTALATGRLFNADELRQLTVWLSKLVGTADLLGRARVRERMRKAQATQGLHRFADEAEIPLAFLPESVPLLAPSAAIRYFSSLVPLLGTDPFRWSQTMERSAFTIAYATDTSLLDKIQEVLTRHLQEGTGLGTSTADVDQLLTEAGIHPRNPQYAQMVVRTNGMDAYNVGLVHELDQPDTRDFFPVWQYLGIRDGREGDDHRPHFGLYYPNTLTFHLVRGKRVFNCRCTPRPVDKYEWNYLQGRGVKLSGVDFANAI